jgi:hypothetical protein
VTVPVTVTVTAPGMVTAQQLKEGAMQLKREVRTVCDCAWKMAEIVTETGESSSFQGRHHSAAVQVQVNPAV